MKRIKDGNGRFCRLSDEVYVLKKGHGLSFVYSIGTKVRLISGIQGSKVPGFHFEEDWVTVCRVDAKVAEFRGFPKSDIELLEES